MKPRIELVEVGPRDGLQIDPVIMPTELKIELIQRLIDSGLRRIEVGSFVNPRKVPQMADTEQVLAGLQRPEDVQFTGLVLNRRGFDRAVAAGCTEIGMVVVASDTFNRRNQGASTKESIDVWLDVAEASQTAGVRSQITISAAFGCPFEGEMPVARVLDIARQVAESRPYEICFADSIGVAVPAQVSELLERVRANLPGMRIRCHFHNTRNTGIANAYAAIQSGVSALDASIGGIGGCPFAPAATGNIATEDLLYMLERSGVETSVSLASLIETARWLETQLGRAVPSMLSKSGPFPAAAAAH